MVENRFRIRLFFFHHKKIVIVWNRLSFQLSRQKLINSPSRAWIMALTESTVEVAATSRARVLPARDLTKTCIVSERGRNFVLASCSCVLFALPLNNFFFFNLRLWLSHSRVLLVAFFHHKANNVFLPLAKREQCLR